MGRAGERGLSDAGLGAWEGGDDCGAGGLEGRSVVTAARRLLVTGGGWGGDVLGSFSWGSLLVKPEVSLRSNVPRIGVTSDGQGRIGIRYLTSGRRSVVYRLILCAVRII